MDSLLKNANLNYIEDFLSRDESMFLFNDIMEKTKFEQKTMTFFEKIVNIPRLTAWFGVTNYTYAGIENKAQDWSPALLILKENIEKKFNIKLNSCLVNLYRDGSDHVSWHSDNEKELGENSIIVSISLGAIRSFQIKSKYTDEKIKIDLKNGSLVLMGSNMQKNYLHRLAPTKKHAEPRINITLRYSL